jgi:hypothetical protein
MSWLDVYDDGDYRRDVPRRKKTNTLLVRRPLGKVKPTTYRLPKASYVYGRAQAFDEESAAQVVGSWKQHRRNPEALPGRDFVRLNKQAALYGCTTSKGVATFRRSNDIRLRKTQPISAQGAGGGFNPNSVFGRPSEPSAGINDLISNSYQRNWILEQRAMKAASKGRRRNGGFSGTLSHTRASLGHTKTPQPGPVKVFKLAQFTNVPSRYRFPTGYGKYPGYPSTINFSATAPAAPVPPAVPTPPAEAKELPAVVAPAQAEGTPAAL